MATKFHNGDQQAKGSYDPAHAGHDHDYLHEDPTLKVPAINRTIATSQSEFIAGIAREKVSDAVIQVIKEDMDKLRGHMSNMTAAHASGNDAALDQHAESANIEIRHIAAMIRARKDELTEEQYRNLTDQLYGNPGRGIKGLNQEYREVIQSVGLGATTIDMTPIGAKEVHEPLKEAFHKLLGITPVGSLEEETRRMRDLFIAMEQATLNAIRQAFDATGIDINKWAENHARMKILARREEDVFQAEKAAVKPTVEQPLVQAIRPEGASDKGQAFVAGSAVSGANVTTPPPSDADMRKILDTIPKPADEAREA